jgi:hypothetical protein
LPVSGCLGGQFQIERYLIISKLQIFNCQRKPATGIWQQKLRSENLITKLYCALSSDTCLTSHMFKTSRIVALSILTIILCVAAYLIAVVIPTTLARRSYEGAKQIGDDIRKVFQFTPEITVNNTVVLQQQTSILELAVLSQTFKHEYEWINTWAGSTKKIRITGTFEAKAGFDLQKKFSITINEDKAIVTLPQPQLLSIEQGGDLKFEDENGVWNWVNQEDRAKAVNAFNTDAKKFAQQALFVSESKTKVEEQLRKILTAHGKEVEFSYTESLSRDL